MTDGEQARLVALIRARVETSGRPVEVLPTADGCQLLGPVKGRFRSRVDVEINAEARVFTVDEVIVALSDGELRGTAPTVSERPSSSDRWASLRSLRHVDGSTMTFAEWVATFGGSDVSVVRQALLHEGLAESGRSGLPWTLDVRLVLTIGLLLVLAAATVYAVH